MENIEKFTEEQLLSKETFDALFKKEGFERMQTHNSLKLRAKKLTITKMFDSTYRHFLIDHVKKNRSESGYKTSFTDCESIFCGDWIAEDLGIKKNEINFQTGQTSMKEASRIPILPIEILENMDTGIEKIKLKFRPETDWKHIICEKVTISSNSKIVELANKGIDVTTDSAKLLVQYLHDCTTLNQLPRHKSISRLGWVGDKFMPYDNDLVFDGENEYKYLYDVVSEKGDYKEWIQYMKPLRKNIYFRLMMAASFASPLIEKTGTLPFIFGFWGGTGSGKTVSLMAAMSIWGNPAPGKLTKTMNMTQNSMMATAAFLHNLPFGADELQTIKKLGYNYDSLIMKLTEGIDRGRMSYDKVNETKTWKCPFLFTSEEPCTKSNSGGGTKNRVIEIEATEKILDNGNDVVNFICDNYGMAGKEYIKAIKQENLQDMFKDINGKILQECETTEKQGMAMALMLLGDKLAVKHIFKDEPEIKLNQIKPFLMSKDEVDASERAYEWFVDWIAQNNSRFEKDGNNFEVWGKVEDAFCIINRYVLMSNMDEQGYDFTAIINKWNRDGRLEKNTQGKFTHQTKVHGIKGNYIKVKVTHDVVPDEVPEDMPF